MNFNTHSRLKGQHAFLSASKYHWIGYTEDKLDRVFMASLAAQRGNELHAFAHDAIRLGIKLPKNNKTLNMYINDAIGYRMTPEQILYYSDNCFGTADCISFRRNTLRIHDLKTGTAPTSEHQLEVYAALFCLEYKFKPFEFDTELRIYQNDEVRIYDGDPDAIFHIMDRIVTFDKRINTIREEVLG
jgi:hypothetical protein